MGSTSVRIKYRIFLVRESVTAILAIPKAVKPSTISYWNARGIIPSVKVRIPQTESSVRLVSFVKSPTNREEQVWLIQNITVVKPAQRKMILQKAFRILAVLPAP